MFFASQRLDKPRLPQRRGANEPQPNCKFTALPPDIDAMATPRRRSECCDWAAPLVGLCPNTSSHALRAKPEPGGIARNGKLTTRRGRAIASHRSAKPSTQNDLKNKETKLRPDALHKKSFCGERGFLFKLVTCEAGVSVKPGA